MSPEQNTRLVKETAARKGFDYCGISAAVPLDEDARRLESWLNKGYHGQMAYMENHFDLRVDPAKLVPGARSVITLLKNYFPSTPNDADLHISKYAYGEDYHEVIREKLKEMLAELKQSVGDIHGRGFVDSAPVLERSWALRSGLGWIGKNGNLITRQAGSFFFIATLITDLDLVPDDPFIKDFCGSCTRCLDACPTQAILPDKTINGSQCISYFTIELKEELIPSSMKGKFQNWMFGCDVCQDVCPWNRFSKPHSEASFDPLPGLFDLSGEDWISLTEDTFKKMFKNSPLKRAKLKGIQRNVRFISGSPAE
jgi:epoxyqueuosine reductase